MSLPDPGGTSVRVWQVSLTRGSLARQLELGIRAFLRATKRTRLLGWRVAARRIVLILATSLVAAPTGAAAQVAPGGRRKQAGVVRAPSDSIRVDGRLDEGVWALATPVDDFVQKEPIEGVLPTERTEVRFLFDDDALYVGARMYSSTGRAGIQAPLGRRDSQYSPRGPSGGNGGGRGGGGGGGGVRPRSSTESDAQLAEYILISLDTYLDRRTAYTFGVTASGVRLDHFHFSDREASVDQRFDPVWRASVTIDEQGWTAEMQIPFTQLRFNEGQEQLWGLNMHRWIPSKNEDDYWVAVPRTEEFWASRFGELRGIGAIDPGLRVEVLPYMTGGSQVEGNPDPANPFADRFGLEGRIGADFKMGVGPNLTLDAAVTPDFGQVELDPTIVNLSDTEVIFAEQRPFFTEGSGLINGPTTNYFLSRRIGAPPQATASGDFVDAPAITTILGAAKLTGRLPSGTSVGVLGAVTGAEHSQTFDLASGSFDEVRVSPRTLYGVVRVQQEFGRAGSTASLIATGVQRDVEPGDPLAALLRRHALMVGGDAILRLAGGAYEVSVSGGLTRVDGDKEVILRAQEGRERYFQRPDATHVEVDPNRTSLAGGKVTIGARSITGAHWLWDTRVDFESPELAFNDVGRLGSGDGIMATAGLTYRETEPGEFYRRYRFRAGQSTEWNYGGVRQSTRLTSNASLTWSNFWTTSVSAQFSTRAQSSRLTRGGPLMGTAQGWSSSINLENNSNDQTRWSAALQYGRDEWGGWRGRVAGNIAMVPGPRWQVSLGPSYEREVDPRQYLTRLSGGSPATFGSRYIFGFIDRTTIAVEARVNFTLGPDLTLDFFVRPFAASGRYFDLGELPKPRSRMLRTYGTDGTTIDRRPDGDYEVQEGADTFILTNRDFNLRSVRSTTVLRWEWRPGSTLFVVWQQDRSGFKAIVDRASPGDLFGSLAASGDNFFAVKVSYWLGL